MPQDSCGFERNRYAIVARYHSRRVVRWWAGDRHSRAVSITARGADQLANTLHLVALRSIALDAGCVKLYPHRLGVEVIEKDLNLKQVLIATSLNLHLAEVQRGPFLFQTVLPIDHLPADCAFVANSQTVGCSS